MDRPLVAGASSGLLCGLFFAASFFGWSWATDLVGGALVALVVLAAFLLPLWSPASRPFQGGLRFGGAAATVLLLSWLAMAGTGFLTVSPQLWRTALAFVVLVAVSALLAAVVASVSWVGGRVVRRAGT